MAFITMASSGRRYRRIDASRRGIISLDDPGQGLAQAGSGERWLAGHDVVERGSQAVNVARGTELIHMTGGLLRTHERGSPHASPRHRLRRLPQ